VYFTALSEAFCAELSQARPLQGVKPNIPMLENLTFAGGLQASSQVLRGSAPNWREQIVLARREGFCLVFAETLIAEP